MGLIDQKLHGKVSYYPVQGGLFLWGTLPEGVDMMDFCSQAVHNKVALVPGTAFTADQNASSQSFRMNYSTPTDQQIVQGIEILSRLTENL